MNIPTDRWYDAIFLRFSQRKYSGEKVEQEKLDDLEKVCQEFRPFPGARIELVREPDMYPFKGLIGPIMKVKDAPHYIKFIVNKEVQNHQAAIGYIGEAVILEATSLGLNTCWVTGFFHSDKTNKTTELTTGEKVIGVSPIGFADKEKDRIGKEVDYKRKSLDDITLDEVSKIPEWQQKAIEAARVAPSATNRQPWRFTVTNKSILVSCTGRFDLSFSKRLDCGIAMLHIELGAKSSGKHGSWIFEESPKVATYTLDR
ncbi:MAG: hypothetical protein BAJATHORv1_10663 [Candidatus Thorarchaeota archaeon]|nr:MAG: hypothetical protein BAJATHORv1_10663 [Candidatus Thorarchaeota archaeon]